MSAFVSSTNLASVLGAIKTYIDEHSGSEGTGTASAWPFEHISLVAEVPATPDKKTVYLVSQSSGADDYDIYFWYKTGSTSGYFVTLKIRVDSPLSNAEVDEVLTAAGFPVPSSEPSEP
jgi:hypothetical protein